MSEMTIIEKETSTKKETTTKLECAVMDQLPWQESRAESPLHHADLASMANKTPVEGGVYLQEQKLLGHLVLRGSLQNDSFTKGFAEVVGFALPGPLQSTEAGDTSVRWIAPDEWLLIVPGVVAFSLEKRLREMIDGHFAITNVSGGQTVLVLSGNDAINVLKKSIGYDLRDCNFPVGKVVTTTFVKTQAVIRRTGEQQWELVIRRSFADYVWLWLQDACAEYGLVVRG